MLVTSIQPTGGIQARASEESDARLAGSKGCPRRSKDARRGPMAQHVIALVVGREPARPAYDDDQRCRGDQADGQEE